MLTAMGDVLREAYRRGWITTRDGNVSVRQQNRFYITPSGVRKTIIHPEHIMKFKVQKDGQLTGAHLTTKPSGELEMHRLLQTTDFKSPRSIVHIHPTHVIAAMEAGWDLRDISERLQELSRFTKVGPNVEKLPVTSNVLALHTLKAMTTDMCEGHQVDDRLIYDVVGQEGHGVTAIGRSPWDAFEHIERLNHACEIILLSGVKP